MCFGKYSKSVNSCRKKTKPVYLGNLKIGDFAPITVQSMTKTDSKDLKSTLLQIRELISSGCEIIRISIPDRESADNLKVYVQESTVPVVADIHFSKELAISSIKSGVQGVRINPGNIGGKERVKEIIKAAKDYNCAIRIGVNAGSLEKHILKKYGSPVAEAMVESALYWVKFFEDHEFHNFKVSIKSSNVWECYKAHLLFAEKSNVPVHLGITEAGFGEYGAIKSAVGIGGILLQGIGDTIRVSLTGNPVKEVETGFFILRCLGLREGVEVISCPTCSRVKIDVESLAKKVWERFKNVKKCIKIAVMGCEVNGPGEAREADVGVAGGEKFSLLFRKGVVIEKVKNEDILDRLEKFVNEELEESDEN